jgi:hypothetical protein
VFHNKSYFTNDRAAKLAIDIAIEVYMAVATEPSILWIWECKDLARPVDVEEFETFHAKLDQIGADNTKGTLISRGPFTKSAVQYAKSKKLGVAPLFPNEIVRIANYSGPPKELVEAATEQLESILCDLEHNFSSLVNHSGPTLFALATTGDNPLVAQRLGNRAPFRERVIRTEHSDRCASLSEAIFATSRKGHEMV